MSPKQRGTAGRPYVDDLREHGVEFTGAAKTEHRVSVLPMVLEGMGPAVVNSWRRTAERAGALVLSLEPNAAAHRADQPPRPAVPGGDGLLYGALTEPRVPYKAPL
ncbi:hypothetical protein [Nonomuraea sp. B19D2]|uniref:hypothetical protein n=1 Tax=Nonomuraea sp. B19D2 TaxID=3159561 RepID=UPI0032DAB8D5